MIEDYRLTVAAIVLRPINRASSPYPPVLLQWSQKAALKGEGNLATVQGGVDSKDPDLITAMKRELSEEHGLRPRSTAVYPVNHPVYRSDETGKEYIWFLARCADAVALVPDPNEVAAANWYYCPQTLRIGVQQMSRGKARMFQSVFALACEQHPELFGDYARIVSQARKRHRRQQEQLAHRRHLAEQHRL